MTDIQANNVLLSLVVPPLLEDTLVDLLLEHNTVNGFTSHPINGHGISLHSLTPAEKVSGRQRQILFQTYLASEYCDELITNLNSHLPDSGIHYWVTPVIKAGRIQELARE